MKKFVVLTCSIFLTLQSFAQITRTWVASHNGQGDFNDRFTCVAKDSQGNFYLGGSTVNPDQNRDYLLVKVNSTGATVWTKQFAGTGKGPDEITAMTIDANNDIYVTGFMKRLGTGTDFFTIKLNSNGDTAWTHAYNYAVVNGYDQANAIAVDASGNVYVCGQSDQSQTSINNDDYATIKYNSSGIEQWVARYNGIGNAIDRAVGVGADSNGNVYVSGRSSNGGDDDYVTIKYNSTGAQTWIKTLDRGGRDRVTDLVFDGTNVFITGRSSNGSDDDYLTVKYTANGTLSWQSAYDFVDHDRATSLTTDGAGNVFVTGQSDSDPTGTSNFDYATVAYNSQGNQIWAKRYNSAAVQSDIANDISYGADQNVYVVGMVTNGLSGITPLNDVVTLSYTANNGTLNWTKTIAGSAGFDDEGLAVVGSGSGCVIAGSTENANAMSDAIGVNYASNGNLSWQASFNGIGDNNDNIHTLAFDGQHVYGAGYIVEKDADRNFALFEFDSNGNFVCQTTATGDVSGSGDDASNVFVTPAGNPFLAGFVDNANTSNDLFWMQTNAATCDTLWTFTNTTLAEGSDKIYDMTTDNLGNYYIGGRIDQDPSNLYNYDSYVAKLDANGNIVWSQTLNTTGTLEDRTSYVRLNSNQDVIAVGRNFNGTNYNILVTAYSNSGTLLWSHSFDNGGNDYPSGVQVDAANNIFITGRAESQVFGEFDYVLLKYSSSGSLAWSKIYNGSANGDDEAQALALDANGNIFVTGKSDTDPSANQNMDMVTLRYDANGNITGQNTFDGDFHSDDIPDDIAVGPYNKVYITGHTNKAAMLTPNYDIVTRVISNDLSNLLYQDIFNGDSDSSDVPNSLYVMGNEFYIAGSTTSATEQRNGLVIKYSGSIPDGVDELSSITRFNVYPNPAFHEITIQTNFFEEGLMLLELTDVSGRLVKTQQIVNRGQSVVNLEGIPEGIYFYQITKDQKTYGVGKLIHGVE